MRRKIGLGFVLMFLSSYLDSVRGPLLPIFQNQLQLTDQQLSFFLVAGHVCAAFIVYFLGKILKPLGTRFCLQLILGSALLIPVVAVLRLDWITYIALGCLFGGVNTALGFFASLFVLDASHPKREARIMSSLHTLYGLSSMIAALIVSAVLALQFEWTWCLWLTWPLVLMTFLLVPKATHSIQTQNGSSRLRGIHLLLFALFGTYVAGEVTISMWMSRYLTEVHALKPENASLVVSGFFVTMTLTRLATGLLVTPKWEWRLLWASIVTSLGCFVAGYFGFFPVLAGAGLVGPFFPVLMSRIKSCFAKEWQQVTAWVVTAIQATMIIVHLLIGQVTSLVGIQIAYLLPILCFVALFPLLLAYRRLENLEPSI